jgi:hypothetical protein
MPTGSVTPAGGGGGTYTPPITRAQYGTAAPTTIANNANANIAWELTSGSSLLDLTTPDAPTVVTAGVYAVTVFTSTTAAMTANGRYEMAFDLDRDGDDPQLVLIPGATSGPVRTTAALTYYCPAGAVLQVNIANKDGVASRDFTFIGVIQRLS